MKSLLGLALAFAIGFACRAFDIPSPAPPIIVGALLVVAMTTGYLLVDRLMSRPAQHAIDCGGPSGLPSGSGCSVPHFAWQASSSRSPGCSCVHPQRRSRGGSSDQRFSNPRIGQV